MGRPAERQLGKLEIRNKMPRTHEEVIIRLNTVRGEINRRKEEITKLRKELEQINEETEFSIRRKRQLLNRIKSSRETLDDYRLTEANLVRIKAKPYMEM